jgi:D-sedoheptulose 7-phosphate isomerase
VVAAQLASELLGARTEANALFFEREADRIARLCHELAERFVRGGRLVALGESPQARSDVRHVAVEFVHPVIVGKRALPAIGLSREGGPLERQVELVARPDDIAIGFDAGARAALALARERGCLTIAYEPLGAEWEFEPPSDNPFVRQELAETHYHLLWELCHVFFEHLSRGSAGAGASSFLYPFLGESEAPVEGVIEDVRASVLMKAGDVERLREQTLTENRDELIAAAEAVCGCGTLFALGNGGSATDAMDVVADFRAAPQGWPPRAAVDLTEDAAILTAIANDIGTAAIFQRQVIAYGREGDALLALSTSGSSENVLAALAEARRRGMNTVAMVGYDGGRVAAERLADHVIVSRSEHIPRIQEAQASAYHALRELVEAA